MQPKTSRIIGIDPGLSGALAYLDGGVGCLVDLPVAGKKVSAAGLHDLLASWTLVGETTAYVEQPVVRIAGKPIGASSGFRIGHNFGIIEGVLASLYIPLVFVSAQKWKSSFGLLGKDKEASRARALELYPRLAPDLKRKKDHGRAEALLIARYGSAQRIAVPEPFALH